MRVERELSLSRLQTSHAADVANQPAAQLAGAPSRLQRVVRALSPWAALLCLYVLFELPGVLLSEPLRPTADLAVLLVAYVASQRLGRAGTWLRIALAGCAAALAFYRIDRSVFLRFMQQEPQLYDQVFMVRHLLVLFADVWTWRIGVGLGASVVGFAALIWLCGVLLRRVRTLATLPRQRRIALALAIALCLGTAVGPWLPARVDAHIPQWMTPALIANLRQSRALYASVCRQLHDSPYRAFDGLRLARKPDVYLLIIESYGRAMLDRPELNPPWQARLQIMETELARTGWHTASAFSEAPVSGGRSWLADGTLLMGIHVRYESVFHHLISQIDKVPNLVKTLQQQGYYAMSLAPSDRKRLGVEDVNYYGYDQVVRFDDLHYSGAKIGWGIVPDQYSLSFVDQNLLANVRRPLFMSFHMVSSHAPWQAVPELVADWRTLSGDAGAPSHKKRSGHNATWLRMRRYGHEEPPEARTLSSAMLSGYSRTVLYDLELVQAYLSGLQGDALVIVMGDHQPPLIAGDQSRPDAPVHVFARDPALLAEFEQQGFKSGLQLTEQHSAAVRHEGLFSLIVRALARCCGDGGKLPTYLHDGSPL